MKQVMLIASTVALLALAGCGSSSSSSTSSGAGNSAGPPPATSSSTSGSAAGAAAAGGATVVTMKNLAFQPTSIQAKVGQTVTWTNQDTAPHNVTYVSGPKFTSSSTLNMGQKFQLKLSQAGTISYYCSIHPFMKATIVVTK